DFLSERCRSSPIAQEHLRPGSHHTDQSSAQPKDEITCDLDLRIGQPDCLIDRGCTCQESGERHRQGPIAPKHLGPGHLRATLGNLGKGVTQLHAVLPNSIGTAGHQLYTAKYNLLWAGVKSKARFFWGLAGSMMNLAVPAVAK